MSIKFSLHVEGIDSIKNEVTMACSKAEHVVAIQAQKDTSPFVPMLTGSFDTQTRVDGALIIYPGPKARFLYYGNVMIDPNTGSTYAPKGGTKVATNQNLVFTRAFHGNAQAHWFEASKAQNFEKWVKVGEKAVKNELKK